MSVFAAVLRATAPEIPQCLDFAAKLVWMAGANCTFVQRERFSID
jgi:hypothetical protein